MELLQDISHKYTMSTYDVFNHNCNNFTDEVAQLVLGEGIPKEIVDLPKEFLATPMGKSLGPMIMGQQQNLMQNSNVLFNTNDGPQPGPSMGGMGGMPPMGNPGAGAATNTAGTGSSTGPNGMNCEGGVCRMPGADSSGASSTGAASTASNASAGGAPAGMPPGMPPGMEQMMNNPQMMQQAQQMMQNPQMMQ